MTPFILVIFGATGDLARNKLIPSLFSLFKEQELPTDFYIIGFARRTFTDEEFALLFTKFSNDPHWNSFAKHLKYQQGHFAENQGYQDLVERLSFLDNKHGAEYMRLFYLATPPINYEEILDMLQSTQLAVQTDAKKTRVIIEKPFGKDLNTAKMLDAKLAHIFEEKQIFRVDHYLAKETVQNILAFRFANSIFEPVWNSQYIDHVQITFFQDETISGRGAFFDGVGLLRDIGQNHLLQLLAAVAMEQPTSFTKEAVRDARATAIKAIAPVLAENVVRGQYVGYLKEKNVKLQSMTETYAALKLTIDTPRFNGVPFYIRTGKAMQKEVIEISVVFIQTCHLLFKEYGCPEIGNVLTFRIQPDEGISMRVIAKKPGNKLSLDPVRMHFTYQDAFKTVGHDAYEKLLLDILAGDQMLFNRSDELASSWQLITQILTYWKKEKSIPQYKKGSFGPKEAEELIERDNRKWLI